MDNGLRMTDYDHIRTIGEVLSACIFDKEFMKKRWILPLVFILSLTFLLAWQQADNGLLRGLIVLSVLLMAYAAWYLEWHTARPLRRFRDTLTRLSRGERGARVLSDATSEAGDAIREFSTWHVQQRGEMEALETALERLTTVSQQMTDGIVMTNLGGIVQSANAAALALFDAKAAQVIGRTFAEFVRHHEIIDLWQKCSEGNAAVTNIVEIGRGGLFLQVSVTPLTENEQQSGFVIILTDLTAVRRLETVRRDFISNISHELRSPLAALRAVIETLQDGALDDRPAAVRFLARAEGEIDALTQMVEELLELSRIESGRVPLQLATVTVEQLVQAPYERMLPQAKRNGLELVVNVSAEVPPVFVDAPRIQQVLTNLLHNAIKFTPENGQITIAAKQKEEKVQLSVSDTGSGIPAHALPRIFERFYKLDTARTRSSGGTGLGLAIAKHIVQIHGGEIWATSKFGKGSQFNFTLPLAEQYAEVDSAEIADITVEA